MERYTKIFILEVINIISIVMMVVASVALAVPAVILQLSSMVGITIYAWAGISERMRDVYVSTE